MKVSEFYKNELVNYASYSTLRMIASAIDGQKNVHRKILCTVLDKNIKDEIKVSQLNSKMAEYTSYLHGDASAAIVTMAKDYSGTNNVPLLEREGNFGTRFKNEASAPRYIYTYGSKELWQIIDKRDDPILETQYFEGDKIEPRFYLPSLPLILVNGSEGIASGFAQKILPRNPEKIQKYLKDYLKGKLKPTKYNSLEPYFEGFRGTIVSGEKPNQWKIMGSIKRLTSTKILITEVPVGIELKSYLKVLDDLEEKGVIKGYKDKSETSFEFEVSFPRGWLDSHTDEQILDKLKLIKTVTENFTAIDEHNRVKVFEGPKDLFDHYIRVKKEYLQRRKDHQIQQLADDIRIMVSKYVFVQSIVNETLVITKRPTEDIIKDLEQSPKIIKVDQSYDYLLNMNIRSLTQERMDRLMKQIKDTKAELDLIKVTSIEDLWLQDLGN